MPKLSQSNIRAWSDLGFQWDDPRVYLAEVFQAEDRKPEEAKRFLPTSTGSRLAQVLKDLAVYEEALRRFTTWACGGRDDLEERISRLHLEKATVHRELNDGMEALSHYNQGIAFLKTLVGHGRADLAIELARASLNKAITLAELGHHQAALNLYDEVILLVKPLVYDQGQWQWSNDLAKAYVNKANVLDDLGRVNAADELFYQADQLRCWLVVEKKQLDVLPEMAQTLQSWAVIGRRLQEPRKALEFHDRAIAALPELCSPKISMLNLQSSLGRTLSEQVGGPVRFGTVLRSARCLRLGHCHFLAADLPGAGRLQEPTGRDLPQ